MDVVELILARSDVEDVLRFKSICKSWYSLISSDYFVKAHLKRSYNNSREHGSLRILLHWIINNVTNNKLRNCMMVGSCNGLVCVSTKFKHEFLVTNPCTKEVRKLPMFPYKIGINVWGFVYDFLTDDYKVVVGRNESKHHIRFQVLSLKSDKWKFVGDGDYLNYNTDANTRNPYCGILYDGALHWYMDVTKKKKKVILSFDLSLEKFQEIPLPNEMEYKSDDRNVLGLFEERLCILRYCDAVASYTQIWVMKNYNCWQLLPPDYEGTKYGDAITAHVLNLTPDNTWRLCDDDKGTIDLSWYRWYHMITYPIFVKSLVSTLKKKKKNNKRKRRKIHMRRKDKRVTRKLKKEASSKVSPATSSVTSSSSSSSS
ncbi:F-box protein CPR1-like [Rutidosis leptorrhynchoides]|uniref:F-box protein CPR1-like n=1 Tax=Rutidosis leptorrhynchoides TaxID=125765 RepID=UPI003A997E2E